MIKLFRTVFLSIGLLFLLFCFLVLRPVPIVSEQKALEVDGVVQSIFEGGEKDVVIVLKNHPTRFYINRGLENGLELEQLENELLHQKVSIKYPKYWTPLDWNNRIKHLSKLTLGEKVIFNELKF